MVLERIDDVNFEEVMNDLSSSLSSFDTSILLDNIPSLINGIHLEDGSISIKLDTAMFNIGEEIIDPIINFDENGIKSILLNDVLIDGVSLDIEIKQIDYQSNNNESFKPTPSKKLKFEFINSYNYYINKHCYFCFQSGVFDYYKFLYLNINLL